MNAIELSAYTVRQAIQTELFTKSYNAFEAIAALTIGVISRSVSLETFGLDSLIEIGAGLVVFWRLKAEQQTPDEERIELIDKINNFNVELKSQVEIATAELTQRNRELRELNEKLFKMQLELFHLERLAVAGQLTATFAHEVGTPLGIVSGRAEVVIGVDASVEVDDFTLESPYRIVIDLKGATLAMAPRYDRQARGGVTNIRAAQNKPNVVRVVIELDAPHPYEVSRGDGQVLVDVSGGVASFSAWHSSPDAAQGTVASENTRAPVAPSAPVAATGRQRRRGGMAVLHTGQRNDGAAPRPGAGGVWLDAASVRAGSLRV